MNLISRRVDLFIIGVHTAAPPSAAEWEQLLELGRCAPPGHLGTLIYTEGGSPSALQRKQLRETMTQSKLESQRTAVLTDSLIARTAITALNIFLGGTLKAFSPTAVEAALSYLEAPTKVRPLLIQALEEMKSELGIGLLANNKHY